MNKKDVKHLNQLGNTLQSLYSKIKVAQMMAPINASEERERLLFMHHQGEEYHPQFQYKTPPTGWQLPLQELSKQLRPEGSPWEAMIAHDVTETLQAMAAAESHDAEEITRMTVGTYGLPTKNLADQAYAELVRELPTEEEPRSLNAQEIAAQLSQALKKAGLADWRVILLETMSARIAVRSVEQEVHIKSCEDFTEKDARRLLVHEIGTHVFRYVNGAEQPLQILRFGLHGYLSTEEGLANYHERQFGVQQTVDQRRYALRVIAAYLSMENGFYQVFDAIAAHTSKAEAFEITARAKRGFTDTALLGSHVKDQVYFVGERMVTAHLQQHPDDYAYLMSGKIAIDKLHLLHDLHRDGLLQMPNYLPQSLL